MSILSDNLKELREPKRKPSNFKQWLDSLSDEDRVLALEAIRDTTIPKTNLFMVFRESGLKCSKDSFFAVREQLIAGDLREEDIV